MPVSNPAPLDVDAVQVIVQDEVEEAFEGYEPEEVNYTEVVTHANLPDAEEFTNETFVVLVSTGIFGFGRKRAGLWRSDGSAWYRLGVLEGSGGVVFSSPPSGKKRVSNIYFDPAIGKYTMEREE